MKLLLVSDVHLDAPFTWAPPDVARARRRALRQTLQRACEVATERGADALVIAGDLYEHERFSPDTAEFLRTTFAALGMPVIIAPGNHDWYGSRSLYAQVDWSPNVHIFTEDTLRPLELADGFTVWGAAHRAPANTDGFLDGFRVDRGGVNVAVFHGSEQAGFAFQESGKVPHAPFRAEQIPEAGLAHALVGHFHTPVLGEWHTYPGNPDPLTFGEGGNRGAVLIDVADDGSVAREQIPVAVTTVHDIDVDLTGVTNSSEIPGRVSAAIDGRSGVVRATLVGEVEPEVDVHLGDLAGIGAGLDAFVPRIGRITVGYDFDALLAEPTVRGQFVRDVTESDLDDDTRRRVITTGLRALAGRGDDLDVR